MEMIIEMLNECKRMKVLKYVQIQTMSLHPRSTVYWKLIIIRAYIYHGRPDLFFNIQLAIAIYDSKHIYVDIFRIFLLMCCTMFSYIWMCTTFLFYLMSVNFFSFENSCKISSSFLLDAKFWNKICLGCSLEIFYHEQNIYLIKYFRKSK